MSAGDVAARVAAHFPSRFLRVYVRAKIAGDPVYDAVVQELRDDDRPLLDVGCGVGVLPFILRECGHRAPITGIDHDEMKIATARTIGSRYAGLEFAKADARELPPFRGSVAMLDLLHYFDDDAQSAILAKVAAAVAPGGAVIIRDCIRDGGWRYRATYAQESMSRMVRWLKAERLNFPTRERIERAFDGFDAEVRPLWGRTPFNNYLFVFRRGADRRPESQT